VLTDRAVARLKELGIDAESLRKCLGEHCRAKSRRRQLSGKPSQSVGERNDANRKAQRMLR
jgi:hypothetical protein